MRYVDRTYALCQVFPGSFRTRHGFSTDAALRLVRRLQEGVRTVHSHGILIVDLNEMNFLVSDSFGEIYFIDVDSYQTPSFPATALMESVRDRHAKRFSTSTDWFSFAIVSFQMFVGIHPFKGTYAPLQGVIEKDKKLDARMSGKSRFCTPE
jgi:DNA-binding helix-hairpin-helix protein with protein kinase domain